MAATALQERDTCALLRRLHHHAQNRTRSFACGLMSAEQHTERTTFLRRELQAPDISRAQFARLRFGM